MAVILNLGGTKRAFRTVSEVEEEPESHNVASLNTAEEKQKVRKLETE